MDYLAAFEISASAMTAEKTRLEVVAMNLANVNSTRSADGSLYQPLEVITGPKLNQTFDAYMQGLMGQMTGVSGTEVLEIRPLEVQPRLVHEPAHPNADENGYVAYPNINPTAEMINLIETVRVYEANVQAMNAAKSMASRALQIGSSR